MYMKWVLLFLICKTIAEEVESDSANNGAMSQAEIKTKFVGRMRYRDGEALITQNQQKHTDFFFTPFPYLQSSKTECYENVFNDRIELNLQVELYTPELIQTVKDYLYKHQSAICGDTMSSFKCDVSLLPMNGIRLVQKGSHQKYTLEDNWQPTTLRYESVEFIIYASNMTVCEQLHRSLTEKCRLPNFELHYSLHGSQTLQKQVDVNTEQVTSTNMYKQIHVQFPSAEKVLLTGSNFEELVKQSTERIIITLRQREVFESVQDSKVISKQLEQELSTEQVYLQEMNDESWEDLYWASEWTRPDRLAKILGSIFHKKSNDSEDFTYNRQAVKDVLKVTLTRQDDLKSVESQDDRTGLTYREQQRIGRIDTLFNLLSRINASSNIQNSILFGRARGRSGIDRNVLHIEEDDLNTTDIDQESSTTTTTTTSPANIVTTTRMNEETSKQYTMSRKAMEKFLREFFNSVHLVDNTIQPRPINTHLVKMGTLSTKSKLFSSSILVQTQSTVQVLPLRCKPNGIGGNVKVGFVDQTENSVYNLNNHTEIIKLYDEIKTLRDKISSIENKTGEIIANWNKEMNIASNRINTQINNLNTSLTDRITVKIDYLAKNLTDKIKQDLNVSCCTTNVRNNNLKTNLSNDSDPVITRPVTYSSSLTTLSSRYLRPGGTVGNYYYYYEVIRIQVLSSGNYTIACNSTMDTYGFLYNHSFISSLPSFNLLMANDDGNGNSQFKFSSYLSVGQTYILLVTTYATNVIGAFTIYTTTGVVFSKIFW